MSPAIRPLIFTLGRSEAHVPVSAHDPAFPWVWLKANILAQPLASHQKFHQ